MDEKQSPSDRIDAILTSSGDSTHRRKRLFSSRDLRATTIGWEIAIPIVGGPLFGFILDRRFDTECVGPLYCWVLVWSLGLQQ